MVRSPAPTPGRRERLAGEVPRLVRSWFHETERKASHRDFDLLHGGAEDAVQAAVDQALVANGWPSRPHVVGSIATRKTKVADASDEHRIALAELVRRAFIEASRRRRVRLRGSPNGLSFDPLFSNGTALYPVAPESATDKRRDHGERRARPDG